MSMKRQQNLERIAYQLACRDAALQAKREQGPTYLTNKHWDLELAACTLYEAQPDWYLQRAARLWGRMQ